MFYFRNAGNRNCGGSCGGNGQPPAFGPPQGHSCPPPRPVCPQPGSACSPPRPACPQPGSACPPEDGAGKKGDGEKHCEKEKKECQKGEGRHDREERCKKEEKKPERKEEHAKHGEGRDRTEEKRPQCAKIRPCACNASCQCTFNCPDLLRWVLWSSGFFRCNQCEKSGWHHRIGGGSGFC